MPAARNQEVTVRRPRANRAPHSRGSSRAAERRSRAVTRWANQADSTAGRCENDMAGSLAGRGTVHTPHRVQGAGSCPPALGRHPSLPPRELNVIPVLNRETLRNHGKCSFEAKALDICKLYLDAPRLYQHGELVLCCDEKTSIQALERKYP